MILSFAMLTSAFEQVYLNAGAIVNGLAFGFFAFILIGLGLHFLIEDATSRRIAHSTSSFRTGNL